MKIALVCGGPSLERGISLNSARSVLDHLADEQIEIIPFYFDPQKNSYKISKAQLYSNTPSDFDFKLKTTAKPLSQKSFIAELKKCDIAFPAMHGAMGEDGEIQRLFEKNNIPFVASPSVACALASHKFTTNEYIKAKGFYTVPSIAFSQKNLTTERIAAFWKTNNIKKGIVKPATGGSSIGTFAVHSVAEALKCAKEIFTKKLDTEVVMEPFAKGIEFTVIVLQNKKSEATALIPIEIETSYDNGAVFDFRKKYLPTHGTMYYQPPRFPDAVTKKIQQQAEQIFKAIGLRDFARLDGWLMDDGNIWFSDINPISGMEQNSFLFQAGARVGFSHRDILNYILRTACARYGIHIPKQTTKSKKLKPVQVLFGGPSSERQVSLMSGTNVWLKLKKSHIYEPKPYLLDFDLNVWELPYSFALSHTVEEVLHTVKNAKTIAKKLQIYQKEIYRKLGITTDDIHEPFFMPKKYSLSAFIKKSKFVFLGLHGNPGEDGTIQALLEKRGVKHNGPSAKTSRLCMDKFETAQTVNRLAIDGIHSAQQLVLEVKDIKDAKKSWNILLETLGSKTIIVKPRADGCSSGIFRLFDAKDLEKYVGFVKSKAPFVPAGTFRNQKDIVDMPTTKIHDLLFENFIETDVIKVAGVKLEYIQRTGWIETTVGVVTQNGKIHVMNPSITVAEGEVLSVEEKFQGGTGVNITPPPASIIKPKVLQKIKERVGIVATGLGIEGYSRIDVFVNVATGEISVIEANTLPGLTPSTVIYHQALAEKVPLFPTKFLESIIKNKGY